MKTNIQHIVRVAALGLVLMVSLTVGFTVHRSAIASVSAQTQPQILLAGGGGDGGQESHGGKGGGGGGHTHG
jgi:hypothetical protein